MVINLVAGVKMSFPENLRNNLSRTAGVQLDTNGATVAYLRFDENSAVLQVHSADRRAEMLRIRNVPVAGLLVGRLSLLRR
jgi:NurA-like 5'-3' nuclease